MVGEKRDRRQLVPGGHLAALSHPDELADAIERVLTSG